MWSLIVWTCAQGDLQVARFFTKTLAAFVVVGSVALGSVPAANAQGFDVETGIEVLASPNTLIEGFSRLYIGRRISPHFSIGQGIYSAALGDAGGAFFWGFEGVARVPLSDRFALSFSGFLGGGGGAAQVNGDGLMIRAAAALEYRLAPAWDLQLTTSWVRIDGAPINGPAYGLGFRYRLGEPHGGRGDGAGPEFDAMSFYVSHMVAPSGTQTRSGTAQSAISLVAARAFFDLNPRTRLAFSAGGAVQGAQGYMQIMAEVRRLFALRRVTLFVEGGAGFGGGGKVDTGAGLLVSAGAGVSVPLTRTFDAELAFSGLGAVTGGFRATAISLGLVRNFGRQQTTASSAGPGERWAFSAGLSMQQTGPNYFIVPGNPANAVIMQESSIDYFVGRRFYLTGTAQTTMGGGVAGYAIGSVGAGYEFPLSDQWSLSLEGYLGAAGGGGVNTAGGIIAGYRAELDYHITERWRLSLGVGQLRSVRSGGMRPTTVTFGVKIPFTTHL